MSFPAPPPTNTFTPNGGVPPLNFVSMPPPANPFAGQHALVPSGQGTTFTRTTSAHPVNFSAHDLRVFIKDRLDRDAHAAHQLHRAQQSRHQAALELEEAAAATHHRHLEALRHHAAAVQEAEQARQDRDRAATRCHDAHRQVQQWWAAEAAKASDPDAILKLKSARAGALQRKVKAKLNSQISGGPKALKKKIKVIPNVF